jgi:hypothetical protein
VAALKLLLLKLGRVAPDFIFYASHMVPRHKNKSKKLRTAFFTLPERFVAIFKAKQTHSLLKSRALISKFKYAARIECILSINISIFCY